MKRETCRNCGGAIGALQQPYVWREQVVCGQCYYKLANESGSPPPMASLAYATPEPQRKMGKNDIICPNPNCGYCGPGKRKAKGSLAVAILLLLIMVLPGLLYMVVYSGSVIICPKCGVKVRDV